MTFEELGIKPALVSALAKQQITQPTAIQTAAIPELLLGKDGYLHAETGTGKTLAYLLPILNKIDSAQPTTQGIIIAPTHELAIQIQHTCTSIAQHAGIPFRVLLLIGGTSRDRQLEKLKKKPHLVVGSLGRIIELIADGKLKPRAVKHLVVDEADKLLSSEHANDVKKLIKAVPTDRQLIFASATHDEGITSILIEVSPKLVTIHTASAPVSKNLDHFFCVTEEGEKPDMVRKFIHALKAERAMVFVHKNEIAERVAARLREHKIAAADLHGASEKEDRKKAMDGFRSGKIQVLIASDVGARGLDIKGITHVINMDLPSQSSAYLHRVGRTARAGASGVALSLITKDQQRLIRRMEEELGIEMTEISVRDGKIRKVVD